MRIHASLRLIVLGSVLVTVLACGGEEREAAADLAGETPTEITVVNRRNPGERIDLEAHAVKGKTTLFEFFSDRCEPCLEMQPVLEYIAARRPDLVIRQVDIDRPGSSEIDFESPLSRQYELGAVPAFMIYDEKGSLVAEGHSARDEVALWYSQAQMFERGEQDPAMRGIMKAYESP